MERDAAKSVRKEAPPVLEEGIQASGVSVAFGGVRALDGVDFVLRRGELRGLIGPNGAGKTTFLNALTGFVRIDEGSLAVDGKVVTRLSPQSLVRRGVVRTFQDVRLFDSYDVADNIVISALSIGLKQTEAREDAQKILGLLHLEGIAHKNAKALPHGEARRVGVARALAARPRYLLLDEPGAGLNDEEKARLGESIGEIRTNFGCAVLLVDHDMTLVMGVCDTIHVLDFGQTLAVGPSDEIRKNRLVIEAYLGTN